MHILRDHVRRMNTPTQPAQQPATATPGKWFVNDEGTCILGADGGTLIVETTLTNWKNLEAAAPGSDVVKRMLPQVQANARLICAAVNATREAGYTVEEMERGAINADLVELHEGRERIKLLLRSVEKVTDAENVLLAECREALEEAQTKIQRLCQELGRQTDADTPKLFAALARLDAQPPPPHDEAPHPTGGA